MHRKDMNSAYNIRQGTFIQKEEFKKVPLNTSFPEYLYNFTDVLSRKEQSCSKFKVQHKGKICHLENLHRSIIHSLPLHLTSERGSAATNDALCHDDCDYESVIVNLLQMDRNTDSCCSDPKYFQALNKDIYLKSQFRSTSVSIDQWFILKPDTLEQNDKCSKVKLSSTYFNINTEHTLKMFNLPPKHIHDTYSNHKGNENSQGYTPTERTASNIGSNLCSRFANECESKHNDNHYISSGMQNMSNLKRKLPINISECRQKTAKIHLCICRDINVSRTRKGCSLMHRVRNYVRNEKRACFKSPDNRAGCFPLISACQDEDVRGSLHSSKSFWPIKNAFYKENSVVISATNSRIQQTFNENSQASKMCLITGQAIGHNDSAATQSTLLPFATTDKSRNITRYFVYDAAHYYFHGEEQCRYQDSSAKCISYREDGKVIELLVQKDIVTPDVILKCIDYIKKSGTKNKESISFMTNENCNHDSIRNTFSSIRKYSPKCNDLQKNDFTLLDTDIKSFLFCLFESSVESFLSTDKTFSVQLNNTRQLEKPHFASDICVYTNLALSLHRNTTNVCSLRRNFQSTSEVGFFPENIQQCLKYPFKNLGITLEETEEASSSCTEISSSSACNADTIYRTTIRTQAPDVLEIDNRGDLKQNIFDEHMIPNSIEFNESLNNNLRLTDYFPYSNNINLILKYRNNLDQTERMSSAIGLKPFEQKSPNYTKGINISNTEGLDVPGEVFNEETAVHLVTEIKKTPLLNDNIGKLHEISLYETDHLKANSSKLSYSVSDNREKDVPIYKSTPDFVKERVHEKYKLCDVQYNKLLAESSSQDGTYCLQDSENITEETTSDDSVLFSSFEKWNEKFELKAQFDLVLEELSLFHKISEQQEHSCKTEIKLKLEYSNCAFPKTSEIKNTKYNSNTVGSHGQVFSKKEHDSKGLNQLHGQELPCPNWSTSSAEEESLKVIEDVPTAFLWAPAFVSCEQRQEHFSTERAFSHGIGRLTPLKTRTGPLRIGLSKKARIQQLHPYLR